MNPTPETNSEKKLSFAHLDPFATSDPNDPFGDEHALLEATLVELASVVPANDLIRSTRAQMLLERFWMRARRHFGHEEEMMRKYGYPGTADHTLRHAGFLRELQAIRQLYDTGRSDEVTRQVVRFIQTWFTRHNETSDQELSAWLSAGGHEVHNRPWNP